MSLLTELDPTVESSKQRARPRGGFKPARVGDGSLTQRRKGAEKDGIEGGNDVSTNREAEEPFKFQVFSFAGN